MCIRDRAEASDEETDAEDGTVIGADVYKRQRYKKPWNVRPMKKELFFFRQFLPGVLCYQFAGNH